VNVVLAPPFKLYHHELINSSAETFRLTVADGYVVLAGKVIVTVGEVVSTEKYFTPAPSLPTLSFAQTTIVFASSVADIVVFGVNVVLAPPFKLYHHELINSSAETFRLTVADGYVVLAGKATPTL
jgi:hypothetical protein